MGCSVTSIFPAWVWHGPGFLGKVSRCLQAAVSRLCQAGGEEERGEVFRGSQTDLSSNLSSASSFLLLGQVMSFFELLVFSYKVGVLSLPWICPRDSRRLQYVESSVPVARSLS